VNQVATADIDGSSAGGSGLVKNSGGVSLGGNDSAYPADATIDLSAAALGSVPIPALPAIPGLPTGGTATSATNVAALGGVRAQIGALGAVASTKKGGDFRSPTYDIAGLKLVLGSPALGRLLQTLAAGNKSVSGLISALTAALGALPGSTNLGSAKCALTPGTAPTTIRLDRDPTNSSAYAVVIDPATATLTVDLAALLHVLKLDINDLPANTDLLAYVLNNLGKILADGLSGVISGITTPLQKLGADCLSLLPAPVQTLLATLFTTLSNGQQQLSTALSGVAAQLSSAGAPGLKALTDGLAQVVAIGVNVQQGAFPLAGAANAKYGYTSKLKATPDQGTAVVSGQGVVRALEIDVLGGQVASLALANAAAGPSNPQAPADSSSTPVTPAPSTAVPATDIPTGVPAGMGTTHGGSPVLPITLLSLALVFAAGGAAAYRFRGRLNSH
jgi:hypothetical protein